MADISNLTLKAFAKNANTPLFTGVKGSGSVDITGLKPGTVVAQGDYEIAFTDGTNTSGRYPLEGWTVLNDTLHAPTIPTIKGASDHVTPAQAKGK